MNMSPEGGYLSFFLDVRNQDLSQIATFFKKVFLKNIVVNKYKSPKYFTGKFIYSINSNSMCMYNEDKIKKTTLILTSFCEIYNKIYINSVIFKSLFLESNTFVQSFSNNRKDLILVECSKFLHRYTENFSKCLES